MFEPLCNNYVNSILSTRQGLYANNKTIAEENKRLKEEIEKLKGGKL